MKNCTEIIKNFVKKNWKFLLTSTIATATLTIVLIQIFKRNQCLTIKNPNEININGISSTNHTPNNTTINATTATVETTTDAPGTNTTTEDPVLTPWF